MRLQEFSARNVFGYLNFEISFIDSPTILIGPNGSGKTTALRLICALIAPSIRDLLSIDFSAVSVTVEEQSGAKTVQARRQENLLYLSVSGVDEELAINTSLIATSEQGMDHQYAAEVDRSLYLNYSNSKVFRAIADIAAPAFLGLDRQGTALREDLANDESMINPYYMDRKSPARKAGIRSNNFGTGLLEVQLLIQKAYGRTRRIKDEQAQRLRRKLLLTGFEYADFNPQAFRQISSISDDSGAELAKKKDELLSALVSIGVDKSDAKREIDPFFEKVGNLSLQLKKFRDSTHPSGGEVFLEYMLNRASLDRLESLVAAVRAHNERGASLSHRFDAFVSCVNEFFVDSRKEIQIDSVGVLRVRRPDRVEIPVEALSSGERQLLIMLGHLYFNSFGDRSSVFIIDEPEVSLHLRWQEMLLEKMMESNPRAQVIVATHSPEVVGEFHNHCVGV